MSWYKWRELMSSGYSSWQYIHIDLKECGYKSLGHYLDDQHMLANWSEHWRKAEWKHVPKPPKKIMSEEISYLMSGIKERQKELDELEKKFKQYYG